MDYMEEEKKLGIGAKIGYFILALLPFALFFVINIVASFLAMLPRWVDLAEAQYNNDTEWYNEIIADISPSAVFLTHMIMLVVFGIWYFFLRDRRAEKFKLNRNIFKVTFLTAFAMGIASNTTSLIQMYFVPDVVEEFEEMAEMSGLGVNLLTIVASIFIAPIGEELICRGIILTYLRKIFPFWLANVIQALVFGIMHMNWVQGVYAFMIGLILGYSVKKYNSIIPAIIMHFFVNSVVSSITAIIFAYVPISIISIIIASVISILAIYASPIFRTDEA